MNRGDIDKFPLIRVIPVVKILEKTFLNGSTRDSSQIIIILAVIPYLLALAGFKPRIRVIISSLLIEIWRSLLSVR